MSEKRDWTYIQTDNLYIKVRPTKEGMRDMHDQVKVLTDKVSKMIGVSLCYECGGEGTIAEHNSKEKESHIFRGALISDKTGTKQTSRQFTLMCVGGYMCMAGGTGVFSGTSDDPHFSLPEGWRVHIREKGKATFYCPSHANECPDAEPEAETGDMECICRHTNEWHLNEKGQCGVSACQCKQFQPDPSHCPLCGCVCAQEGEDELSCACELGKCEACGHGPTREAQL